MTTPTISDLRPLLERSLALWNEHADKDAWLDSWRTMAPGGLTFEDPVGTPTQHGVEALASLWERPVSVTITMEQLVLSGSEAAAVMRNEGTAADRAFCVHTVETYALGADGSLHVRVFAPH